MVRSVQQLLIDRAAVARRLDDSEVRSWGEDQRVFISSVIDGYEESRTAAAAAVEAVGGQPVMFERFGGRDSDPNQAYLNEVESSSIYVGLIGERYGRLLPSRFSATHEEYRHAERHGLRVSVWAENGVDKEGPQQSFLEEVRVFNVTGGFNSAEDLTAQLEQRLRGIAAENLSPWCKVGDTLFRAREIRVGGGHASIEAVVRDHAVVDWLLALESGFGRQSTTFAYWDGVFDAEVTGISSTTRAGGSRELTIELGTSTPSQQQVYSLNGVSYEEMTELAVKVSWLGEDNPLGLMKSEAEIGNPFALLEELRVPEEAIRPIASLLCLETLVRTRNVGRITNFRLGPPVAGLRRVDVAWTQPSQYSGHAPSHHQVEGAVALG